MRGRATAVLGSGRLRPRIVHARRPRRRTALAGLACVVLGLVVLLATRGLTTQPGAGAVLGLIGGAQPGHGGAGRTSHSVTGQIAPALEARVAREAGGELTTVHFYSRALHKRADYLVYLPAGYSPAHPLPAFYLLHGMPGKPVAFTVNAAIEVRLERLIRARRASRMLLVFPDGRIDGATASDSEWANTRFGDYESYIIDVVRDVDHRFAALACRQERAIAGLSAGAYGAANVGLHRDATFGLVQVWSGYFRETRTGVFARAGAAALDHNSPIDFVQTMRRTLRRYPLRIFIYGGRDDPDTAQVPGMAAALRTQGADVSWAVYAGGHGWATWTPHVDQMLVMASDDFARPLDGASSTCTAA